VSYKAASSGFDASQVQTDLMMAASGYDESDFQKNDYEPSYLYLSPTHDKGQNCQTIKPYIYNSGGVSCSYPVGTDTKSLQEYYLCFNQKYNSTNGSTNSSSSTNFY
jgi:hypothetical protein